MPETVTCLACGTPREASDDDLRARTVPPCACGNGSYTGLDWRTYAPPAPSEAPSAPPETPSETPPETPPEGSP